MQYRTLQYVIDEQKLTVTTLDGELINIRPKTCQFLLVLLKSAGSPVSKQRLLSEVWSDSVVEDQIVFQSVNELRQKFKNKDIIKTIPKQGYVWVNDVKTFNAAASEGVLSRLKTAPVLLSVCLCLLLGVSSLYFFTPENAEEVVAQHVGDLQSSIGREVTGSIVVLPTTNQIQGNDHSWVRLGFMDQVIQRLPSDDQYGVLQTDYVLEVLERASAPLSNVKQAHIPQIFKVSGANLIVATKLSGSPHDYHLSYTLYRPQYKQQGVLFGSDTQSLVDELSLLLANLLGEESIKSVAQYHADFNNQMLGVAIDFRLEGNHKAALPLLKSIVDKEPDNFTAQRILIETMFALRQPNEALEHLVQILPSAERYADKGELVRLLYFRAIGLGMAKDFEGANDLVDSALAIAKENYDWLYQAYLTGLKAGMAMEQEKFELAEQLYHESMTYHQVLKCPVGETISWVNLGLLAKMQTQPEKQKQAFENALKIAQQRDLTNQVKRIKKLLDR